MTESRNAGPQPLDAVLERLKLSNHDLVAASAEQLTHKEVGKGRKGRLLTFRLQQKILRALQAAAPVAGSCTCEELFTYRGH